jgi:hypothetical protein
MQRPHRSERLFAALESKVAVQVHAKSKVTYGGIASVKTAIAGGVCEDCY